MEELCWQRAPQHPQRGRHRAPQLTLAPLLKASPASLSTGPRMCAALHVAMGADREGHASRALQGVATSCVSVHSCGSQHLRVSSAPPTPALLGLEPPLRKLGLACHGLHGLWPLPPDC